ncbi:MAG: CotH kinase family protein [Eubacteriales bacterium]
MKKMISWLAGLTILILLFCVGCGNLSPAEPKAGADPEAGETEQVPARVLGVELLTFEEIDALQEGKTRLSTGEYQPSLFYNGTELASLTNRRVFFVTLPQTEEGWADGTLSAGEGVRIVTEKMSVPDDPATMIACGNRLMLYLIGEETYSIVELVMTYLPVISIRIDEKSELSNTLQGCEFTLHHTASTNQNFCFVSSRAEVRIRGGSSASLPKKSMRLDLKNDDGTNRKLPLLGMRSDDDWILIAMFSDENKVRDMLGWQLWREMNSFYPGVKGSCAPETQYVEVILNGKYQGLYLFMEKFDEKTMKLGEEDALFKTSTWDVPSSADLKSQPLSSDFCVGLEKKYPDLGSWDSIAEYIRVCYETDGEGFCSGVENIANIENQLDYWLFNNITMAGDNTWKNAYFAVKDGKVYTLPWDLDISFGLNWNGDPATNYLYREPEMVNRTYDFQCGRRLIKYYPGAADYIVERWSSLTEAGVVTADHLIENAASYWNLIHASGAVTRELERWPSVSYAEDLTYMEQCIRRRIQWLNQYIAKLEG